MAEDWLVDVRKYAANADENVVNAIVRYCGIALQSRDGQLVAMSDKKERDTVRENYLKKKLGLTNSDAELDDAILSVKEVMKEDRTKNRVTVYYLLAEHFGSLNIFGGLAGAAGAAGLAAAALSGDDDKDDAGSSAAPLAAAGLGAAALGAGSTAAAPAAPEPEPVPEPTPAAAATSAYAASTHDDDSSGGGLGWLKWLLLAALLALLLFFVLRSCSGDRSAVDEGTEPATTTEAPAATGDVAPAPAPAADAAPVPAGAGVTTGERNGKPMLTVYFDTGKSAVTNDLAAAAAKVKAYVADNAGAKLAVSGYNDPTGNAAANAELSKSRAQAVGKALEAAGIPAAAIELVKPEATTDTQVDKAAARRVEVTVQ